MSNDLMIPSKNSVPSFLINKELAGKDYEDASAGINGGFPAKIKLSGKQFTLVDEGGEETPYPPAALVPDDKGNVYLPVIMLKAKGPLSKGWYAKKYNPNAPKADRTPPDCFSTDGLRPDPTSNAIQAETCANCAHNQYGSGKDQDGNPTDGKACQDKKILATYVPKYGIYEFDIPAGSLKNWRKFTDQVNFNLPDIPYSSFKTLIGFDLTTSKSILVFKFGGFVGEGKPREQQQQLVAAVAAMINTPAVMDIVKGKVTAALPAPAPLLATPEHLRKKEVATMLADDDDLGLGSGETEAEAAAIARKAAEEKAAKAEAKKAAAAAKKKADEAAAKAAAEAAASTPDIEVLEVSDDDLIEAMGLNDL